MSERKARDPAASRKAWYGLKVAAKGRSVSRDPSAIHPDAFEEAGLLVSSENDDAKRQQAEYSNTHYVDAHPEAEASRFHDHFRAIPFRRLASLLDRCDVSVEKKRWLVAGCGSGTDLRYLTRSFDATWTAIDVSSSAIQVTQSAFPSVEVLIADLEHLPFRDGQFDVGFVAATLHHLPSRWWASMNSSVCLARRRS